MSQALNSRNTFTLVQFSGVSQLEGAYVPGSNGDAGSGLKHYNIEVPTQTVGRIKNITGANRKWTRIILYKSYYKILRARRKRTIVPMCPGSLPV